MKEDDKENQEIEKPAKKKSDEKADKQVQKKGKMVEPVEEIENSDEDMDLVRD